MGLNGCMKTVMSGTCLDKHARQIHRQLLSDRTITISKGVCNCHTCAVQCPLHAFPVDKAPGLTSRADHMMSAKALSMSIIQLVLFEALALHYAISL